MVAGVRDDAVAAGLSSADDFDAGIRGLERTTEDDGVFTYTFFKATGTAIDGGLSGTDRRQGPAHS